MFDIKKWLATGLLFCSALNVCIAAPASPTATVQQAAKVLMAELKAHQGELQSDTQLTYRLIKRIILPQVDVRAMSRSVIKPNIWRKASRAQQDQFTKAFTELVIRTYASGLAHYSNEQVRFIPVNDYANKKRVKVKSRIFRRGGPTISMDYRLIKRSSGWKVYDVTVEGISLLHSFRSQFASQLQQGNFAQLITTLQTHNKAQHG